MYEIKCPYCGMENKNTNIKCEYCGEIIEKSDSIEKNLNKEEIYINNKAKTEKFLKNFNLVLILAFSVHIIIGVVVIFISNFISKVDLDSSKKYETVEGKLSSFYFTKEDSMGKPMGKATYEFVVNGKNYDASPKVVDYEENYKKTELVYYNVNNPSDNVILINMDKERKIGMFMVIIPLTVLILIEILIKIARDSNRKKESNGLIINN